MSAEQFLNQRILELREQRAALSEENAELKREVEALRAVEAAARAVATAAWGHETVVAAKATHEALAKLDAVRKGAE